MRAKQGKEVSASIEGAREKQWLGSLTVSKANEEGMLARARTQELSHSNPRAQLPAFSRKLTR